MTEGLVGVEGFAVDASLVKADASRQRWRDDDDDGRAVREYLEAIDEGDTQIKVCVMERSSWGEKMPSPSWIRNR